MHITPSLRAKTLATSLLPLLLVASLALGFPAGSSASLSSRQLQAQANALRKQAQASKFEAQVRTLTAITNWGGQIVSSDDNAWYYSQTGDYTRLGSSWYTVNEVGCLITSMAMVSTFYGNHITPDWVAQNAYFTNDGRPVIVSVYLPSVGAVNSDGSSHFIVIKNFSDGRYLMHDPIGPGRGYSLGQVRSMILTSGN